MLQHREVEARVVRDEDGAVEQREQLGGDLGEASARSATSASVMPCTAVASAGIGRDGRTSSCEPPDSRRRRRRAGRGERDDLVPLRVGPGRLAVEDGVAGRRRHLRAPPHASGNRVHGRKGHVSKMSPAPDGALTLRHVVHLPALPRRERPALEQDGFFALGGIAVRDTDWHELRDLWQETLAAHGWPLDREVKWHGIRTGEVPPALADAVVAALAARAVHRYVTLLDIELGRERDPEFFATDEDTYATGLMFLAERFQLLLDGEDDLGMIVVDSRFREDDARLRRFFADLTEDGTPVLEARPDRRGALPRPEPPLDRPAVRRPRRARSPPRPSAATARRAAT